MESKFDAYEIVAVIPSGVVLGLGLYAILYGLPEIPGRLDPGLGDLGLLLVLAFIAGQLIRAISRFLEVRLWTAAGGWPTAQLLDGPGNAMIQEQRERLMAAIKAKILNGRDYKAGDSTAVTREIYIMLHAAHRSDRVDTFNRTYGLYTGLAVTFLLLVVIAAAALSQDWQLYVAFILAAAICVKAAMASGWDYASELMIGFARLH